MTPPVAPTRPVDAPPDPRSVPSSSRAAIKAAQQAIRDGKIPAKMNEPMIGTAGTGVVPGTGAGAHEGERAPVAPGPAGTVTLLEDNELPPPAETPEEQAAREAAEAEARANETPEETAAREAAEAEAAAAGGEAQEWPTLTLPAVRDGAEPVEVEVEDQELAEQLQALARGAIRRDQLHKAMQDIEQTQEQLAAVEDAMRVDPVNFVLDHVAPQTQLDLARHLLAQPEIYAALQAEMAEVDDAGRAQKALELENARLKRHDTSSKEIERRSQIRAQGRQIRAAITRAIPEDMDEQLAGQLGRDLERDITEYIYTHRLPALRVEHIPAIIEGRLALYGVDPEEAAERVFDTGAAPLPVRARPAASAPARSETRPAARTGETLVAQAAARRRAGAVPGGGAGVPAAGIQLPKRQSVKDRIAALRQAITGGGS